MANHGGSVYWDNTHARAWGETPEQAYRVMALRKLLSALNTHLKRKSVDAGLREQNDEPGGGGGGAYTPDSESISLGEFNVSENGLPETENYDDVVADLESKIARLLDKVADDFDNEEDDD